MEAFMATTNIKPEAKARTFGENIESDLASRFLRVVETAAIASARTMGQGQRHLSDQVATEAMRQTMDAIPMRGTIVIGEGERDEAPMLYIGEKVGAEFPDGREVPEVDIAVDLDAPVADNLKNIAKRMERDVEDLVVIVLDRPRHEKLIADIRAAGARIRLIGDGDLSAGIAAAVIGTGVHAVMGTGGAPEGVLTAAALRCLNGEILARLVVDTPEHEQRCREMGIEDPRRIYSAS